jgi:hypothetical protein
MIVSTKFVKEYMDYFDYCQCSDVVCNGLFGMCHSCGRDMCVVKMKPAGFL